MLVQYNCSLGARRLLFGGLPDSLFAQTLLSSVSLVFGVIYVLVPRVFVSWI